MRLQIICELTMLPEIH